MAIIAPPTAIVTPSTAVVPSLEFKLHQQQGRAMRSRATEQLFGGAAGGGKSHLMRVAAIRWCLQIAGLQVYLFRRIFEDLIKNHVNGPTGFRVLLGPYIARGLVAIVQKEVRFWNGSIIYLCHYKDERAQSQYQGAEIGLLLIDELTHFLESMYRFLRGRLRISDATHMPADLAALFPRILCSANPGNIGHEWVKDTFIEPGEYTIRETVEDEGGYFRQFIPSRVQDNPSLDRVKYLKGLSGLGDALLVRAMRDGDWNIATGAMFGEVWRRERHVCDPFPIPDHWPLWRGGDDGFAAPSAIYWITKDPAIGTYYVISEVYAEALLPAPLAKMIMDRDKSIVVENQEHEIRTNMMILSGYYDSAAFSNTGSNETTRGDQMNNAGCRWEQVPKWSGSVVARIQNFHRLLAVNERDPLKRPGIRFFNNCVNAIKYIPSLVRSKHNPETLADNQKDHAFDGVTYGLQWQNPTFKKVRLGGV